MPVSYTLKSQLPEYIGSMHPKGAEWALQTATQIVDVAQGLVAVDTGSLRDTIKVDPGGEPKIGSAFGSAAVVAGDSSGGYKGSDKKAAGKPVDYAGYEEFGTSTHAAHPFMTPAAEQVWPSAIARLETLLSTL
jgi:HK97 gp10 family phage protein